MIIKRGVCIVFLLRGENMQRNITLFGIGSAYPKALAPSNLKKEWRLFYAMMTPHPLFHSFFLILAEFTLLSSRYKILCWLPV